MGNQKRKWWVERRTWGFKFRLWPKLDSAVMIWPLGCWQLVWHTKCRAWSR